MIWENIYNIFKIKTDGEEFDSPEDALVMGNVSYRKLLSMRDWLFLNKTTSISISSSEYTYSSVTDLDKPLALWSSDYKLKKATFDQRKDTNYDYWIDYVSKKIKFINDYSGKTLDLDYKYKPADITISVEPVFGDTHDPIIAFQMILDFYEKDQDNSVYKEALTNYASHEALLIDYNESLRN